MTAPYNETFRGLAVGGMILAAVGAGWMFLVGSVIEGEAPSDASGSTLMATGAARVLLAAVVAHGVIVSAPVRVAVGAIAQAILAILVLGWWVATDFWGDTRHANLSTVPLIAVIVLDGVITLWALRLRTA